MWYSISSIKERSEVRPPKYSDIMNMDFNKTIGSIPDGFEMVLFPEHGISITGASLRKYSGICAAWLQEQGHKTIGIHIANYPEFIYLLAGALRASPARA